MSRFPITQETKDTVVNILRQVHNSASTWGVKDAILKAIDEVEGLPLSEETDLTST